MIYISYCVNQRVISVSCDLIQYARAMDGSFTFTKKCLKEVFSDREDNIVPSDRNADNVSLENKVAKTLILLTADFITRPQCVAYGNKDGTVIIRCRKVQCLFAVIKA